MPSRICNGLLDFMWHFKLLGAVSLRRAGCYDGTEDEITRFRTRKAASLLGFLVLHPGAQGREALATRLWPDFPLEQARNNLRVSLASLRVQIEPATHLDSRGVLLANRQYVQLNTQAFCCDVTQFQNAHKTAQTLAGAARIQALQRAFDSYGGRLLACFEEEWSEPIALHLETLFGGVATELIGHYRECGDTERALSLSSEAALRAPETEDFAALVRQIKREGFPKSVRSACSAKIEVSSPVWKELPYIQTLLPLYPARFWGRDAERQTLEQSLRLTGPLRLQTLTGPPAIGKTRLAVEAAREAAQHRNWCVRFVSLASQKSAASFAEAVRTGLGLPSTSHINPLSQVVNHLRDLQRATQTAHAPGVVLLLDNLEHLLPEVALEVQSLRCQVPEVVIWATSRASLGLPGEESLLLTGLPVPHEEDDLPSLAASPSVQLFVARARRARPAFAILPSNAGAIVRLCRQLEGWPLPLELAAARSHTFTPAQMLEQLRSNPEFLKRPVNQRDTVLARQKSLDLAIGWSFELLSPEAQTTLLALSVFRGGATREHIETLARALQIKARRDSSPLTELVAHSLIVCEEKGGVLRYDLLEGVRAFARRRLSEEEQACLEKSHAHTFASLVLHSCWTGDDSPCFLERLDTEIHNLRAALEWARFHEEDSLLHWSGALWPYWESRGLVQEGRQWLALALELAQTKERVETGDATNPIIEANIGLAHLSFTAGDFPGGEEAARRALELSRLHFNQHGEAAALLVGGIIELYRGQIATALESLGTSRALFGALGEAGGESHALLYLGFAHIFGAAFEHSLQTYQRAVAKAREAKDFTRLAMALFFCGDILGTVGGRYDEAVPYWEESVSVSERINERMALYYAKWGLCRAAIARGELELAERLFEEIDEGGRLIGFRWGQVFVIETAAFLAGTRNQWERVALLLGAAERARETLPLPLTASYYAQFSACFASLHEQLTPQKSARLWKRGRAHSLEEALEVARGRRITPESSDEEIPSAPEGPLLGFPLDVQRARPLLAESHLGIGRLALCQNDRERARLHLEKAVSLFEEIGDSQNVENARRWLEKARHTV